ncbi:MAG TPA: hypothetical protein VJ754_05760 [Anaerolineae bacterium]|nr:hypothetical protein [Anaerolineae bacterium]
MQPVPRPSILLLATLTLLVAAGLRLAQVGELPPGLHYDEAADTILAREIAEGRSAPIFIPAYTGKEVLFFYWAAGWMKLIGATPFAMRLAAAMLGVLTVAATYWAAREMFTPGDGRWQMADGRWQMAARQLPASARNPLTGSAPAGSATRQLPALARSPSTSRAVALLAAVFMATSFWHVLMSRLGFRSIAEPCLQALMLAALWRGLRLNHRGWLILGGAFLGLNLYTYLAARLLPAAVALLFLYLVAVEAGHRRKRLIQFALVVLAALVVFAPLGVYFLQNPDAFFTRIGQVALAEGRGGDLLDNAVRALGMFFVESDPAVRFNLPGRPLFPSVLGILFLVGVAAAFVGMFRGRTRLRRTAYFFTVTSTAVMLLATILTAPEEITPNNLRAIGMLPMVFVFPALGTWLALKGMKAESGRMRIGQSFIPHPSSFILAVVLITTMESGLTYFGHYVRLPQLYYESDGDLVEIAGRLNQVDAQRLPVYVHALHYRHPTLAALARDFAALRSITGADVAVFPSGPSLHIYAHLALPDWDWLKRFLPGSARVETAAGPDGQPNYTFVELDAAPALAPQVPLDVNFGNTIRLIGYDLQATPRSGEAVDVTLYWRVLNPSDRGDYATFVELRDAWDFEWGRADSFDYPSEQWRAGEVIAQRLRVPIAAGAPRGNYQLSAGWYSGAGRIRLPVISATGAFGGTTTALGPISVARPAGEVDLNTLGIGARLDAQAIDGLRLLGASIETPNVPQGAPLFLTLFWRADAALPDQPVEVRLRGPAAIPLTATTPVHNTYPFDEWPPGETLADRYGLRVPADAPAGEYTVEARVQPGEWIGVGQVQVEATQRRFDVPPMAHLLRATFGDQIELLGYDVDRTEVRAGQALTLTLYWRALKTPEADYTVFTHLLDPAGIQRGGQDNPPVNGTYNTSRWLPGEVVVDPYHIPLDVGAPPGEYAIEIGLYLFDSGARLALSNGGDALRVTKIRVAP